MEYRRLSRLGKGFTLIDTAMVVIILAVLLASLLVLRQISINTDTRILAEEFNQVRSAVDTYTDRFGVLPGDDSAGSARWPGTNVSGNCNGVIEGEWDAVLHVDQALPETPDETSLFWQHLRMANLYPGPRSGPEALRQPENIVGGYLGVQEQNFGLSGTVICMSSVSFEAARVLDSQLDDGVASTGRVRGNTVAQSSVGSDGYKGSENYYLCRKL